MTGEIHEISERIGSLDARLSSLDGRVGSLDGNIAKLNATIQELQRTRFLATGFVIGISAAAGSAGAWLLKVIGFLK